MVEPRFQNFVQPKVLKQRNPMNVFFMHDVYLDSIVFNEDAWENAFRFLNKVEPDAMFFSDFLTRVDRPEYKINDLTYFWQNLDVLELGIDEKNKLYDPLTIIHSIDDIMKKEFELLDTQLEVASHYIPGTEKHYLWSLDDGYSVNRVVHLLALRERMSRQNELNTLKNEVKTLKEDKKYHENRDQTYQRQKKTKEKQKQFAITKNQARHSRSRVKDLDNKLNDLEGRINTLADKNRYLRDRKENPIHHMLAKQGYELILNKYQNIFSKHGFNLVPSNSAKIILPNQDIEEIDAIEELEQTPAISVNGNILRVKSYGRSTGNPVRTRPKSFAKQLSKSVNYLIESGVFAVVEGHQGTFSMERFDSAPTPHEVNTGNQGIYYSDPSSYAKSVYGIILPNFHDQTVTKGILDGEYSVRFGGRTPTATRKHDLISMYTNDAISGLFGLGIDEHGRPTAELINYKKFKDGTILPTKKWYMISTQSDTHMNNTSSAYEIIDGAQKNRIEQRNKPHKFKRAPVEIVHHIDGGDMSEGNSGGWPGAGAEYRERTIDQVKEELTILLKGGIKTPDEYASLFAYAYGLVLEGSHENLGVMMQWISDFYMRDIEELVKKSDLETVLSGVGSNHSFGALRRQGINPYEVLNGILKATGNEARVAFDSRDARSNVLFLENFGKKLDGTYDFGPLNVYIQHDPVLQGGDGPSMTMATAAQYNNADLGICGHYHVFGLSAKRFNDRPNEIVQGVSLAALQRIMSTDLFKGGRRRNIGTLDIYIPEGATDGGHLAFAENLAPELAYKSKKALNEHVKKNVLG